MVPSTLPVCFAFSIVPFIFFWNEVLFTYWKRKEQRPDLNDMRAKKKWEREELDSQIWIPRREVWIYGPQKMLELLFMLAEVLK